MNNFTLAMKQALQVEVEGGKKVSEVAYNPNTVIGDPEGDAILAGWTQYYREASANLVEVIYTK